MSFHPNSELVAVAWLRTIPGINPSMVGTTLPAPDVFADDGFVTVTVVGGTPHVESGERAPALQITTYATNLNSEKPPWGKANNPLEIILRYCQQPGDFPITLPVAYLPAVVRSVDPLTEIRRIPDGIYAQYSADLLMVWTDINPS